MTKIAVISIGVWLALFGVLSLVSTEIPKWIVPLGACLTSVVVLVSAARQ